jgi:uncharacterized membrane protein
VARESAKLSGALLFNFDLQSFAASRRRWVPTFVGMTIAGRGGCASNRRPATYLSPKGDAAMIKYLFAYLGAGLTFAAIDAVWLTTMTERLYKPVLGPILADKPDMKAAVAFYLISIGATVFLAIAPALKEGNWTRALINGAVLGFVCYATYDLTNQATLNNWSMKLTLIDLAWGTVLTGTCAVAGYFAARWAEGKWG